MSCYVMFRIDLEPVSHLSSIKYMARSFKRAAKQLVSMPLSTHSRPFPLASPPMRRSIHSLSATSSGSNLPAACATKAFCPSCFNVQGQLATAARTASRSSSSWSFSASAGSVSRKASAGAAGASEDPPPTRQSKRERERGEGEARTQAHHLHLATPRRCSSYQ